MPIEKIPDPYEMARMAEIHRLAEVGRHCEKHHLPRPQQMQTSSGTTENGSDESRDKTAEGEPGGEGSC